MAAAIALVGLGLAGCQEQTATPANAAAPPPAVTVAKPVVREVVEDDEFVGRFGAVDRVEVRARVGGYLEAVHFRDGALVAEGDLLFTIDRRPFELARSIAEAELRVAQSRLAYAEAQFERADTLAERGTIPTSTLDERQQEYLATRAALEGARAALERARLDLEYSRVRAPLGGRIDRRRVSVGNLVEADTTLLTTIVSLDPIDFYFDIDERAFLRYDRIARARDSVLQEGAAGLPVRVRIADESAGPFAGVLDFAENSVDGDTGTVRVRARLPNRDLILQPGLFGRVNVPGSLPHVGILLPDAAVAADQDRRIVYVVEADGTVSARPVRPGPRLHGYRVIREGLTGEETVVVEGLMRVRPGARVTPEMTELPPEVAGSS